MERTTFTIWDGSVGSFFFKKPRSTHLPVFRANLNIISAIKLLHFKTVCELQGPYLGLMLVDA